MSSITSSCVTNDISTSSCVNSELAVGALGLVAEAAGDLVVALEAGDRMIDHNFPLGWGVGRHGPGNNVFAYFVDPFGFVIEYTAEVLQVDDAHQAHGPEFWRWPPGRTDHWGIAPPKPEYVKNAQVAIRFADSKPATGRRE